MVKKSKVPTCPCGNPADGAMCIEHFASHDEPIGTINIIKDPEIIAHWHAMVKVPDGVSRGTYTRRSLAWSEANRVAKEILST